MENFKNGIKRSYYSTGQLLTEKNYVNGLLEGFSLMYHDDGQIMTKCFYENGIENGAYEEYYEGSNQLLQKKYFKDGVPYGIVEYFGEEGNLISRTTYKDRENYFTHVFNELGDLKTRYLYLKGEKIINPKVELENDINTNDFIILSYVDGKLKNGRDVFIFDLADVEYENSGENFVHKLEGYCHCVVDKNSILCDNLITLSHEKRVIQLKFSDYNLVYENLLGTRKTVFYHNHLGLYI